MSGEIIISRVTNGWIIRDHYPFDDPNRTRLAKASVAETPEAMVVMICKWAEAVLDKEASA